MGRSRGHTYQERWAPVRNARAHFGCTHDAFGSRSEAFGGHLEIPWARFANVFQMHFIRATRQDVNKPARAFHAGDFEYLHDKFFGNKQLVSYKDFDQVTQLFSLVLCFASPSVFRHKFWSWFGKGLHILRYQRHVGNLWKSGLIYGFIAKDAVHRALSNERPGSFLVRFSENHAGSFAVAYKHIDVRIAPPQTKHTVKKAKLMDRLPFLLI